LKEDEIIDSVDEDLKEMIHGDINQDEWNEEVARNK